MSVAENAETEARTILAMKKRIQHQGATKHTNHSLIAVHQEILLSMI